MRSNTVLNAVVVVVGFIIAFGVGYLVLGKDDVSPKQEQEVLVETNEQAEESEVEEEQVVVPDEALSLSRNSCLGCHSVESLGVISGDIGPDLSRSFPEMKAKHGKELAEFLKDPTSAVMATVLADKPLEDEEIEQITETLKLAAEKWNDSSKDDEKSDAEETKDEKEEE